MGKKEKQTLILGIFLLLLFFLWSILIQKINVHPIGETNTTVGFATLNYKIHQLIGVHLTMYQITDWLGIIPFLNCAIFAMLGLIQLIKRKSLQKVDCDIILLGVYYVLILVIFLFFQKISLNARPVFINGVAETSYPSSTVLMVVSVMSPSVFQIKRRVQQAKIKKTLVLLINFFMLFMIVGRTISGVHWFSDIAGALLLGAGLYLVYKAIALRY